MSDRGHRLLLPFDTDNADFTRGVEVGHVWTRTELLEDEMFFTVHAENAEMMLRIAEARQCHVQSENLNDGWLEVTFAAPEAASSGGARD